MAATYKIVYPFEVIEKMKNAEEVYMLDREKLAVECVENMEVGALASVLSKAEKEPNRFEFWVRYKED